MNVLVGTISNLQGIFSPQEMRRPLPAPFGIEIENEGDDIVYLGPEIDRISRYGDRMRIYRDLNIAIKEAKHEQTSKAN